MPTNDFLPFASAGGANVLSQADYLALAARFVGFVDGVAMPEEANKAWRQSAAMAAMLGQFINSRGGIDALDNGDITALQAAFEIAYRSQVTNYIATVGGTANALTATVAPALTAPSPGLPLRLKIATNNTGAATLNAGDGARPIVTARGDAIKQGDLVAGAIVTLIDAGAAWMMAGIAYSEVPILGSAVLYVRTDGSDTNDGSANDAAHAFATIAAAASAATKYYASAGVITIQLGNSGTYAAPGNIPITSGTLRIRGNPANYNDCIISGSVNPAGAGGLITGVGGLIATDGVTIFVTGNTPSHIGMAGTGLITIKNTQFSSSMASSGSIIFVSAGGNVFIDTGCQISASASNCFFASAGSIAIRAAVSVAAVAFSGAFCTATNGGSVVVDGASFSGSPTGQRYAAILNGVINTNGGGANFFPGTVAGSTATGGQYA